MSFEHLSPPAQRVLALGILLAALFVLVTAVILPLGSAVSGSVTALQDARFRRDRLEALKDRPAPEGYRPVPPGLYFTAPDRSSATGIAMQAINAAAARAELRIENLAAEEIVGAPRQQIAISLSAHGDETAVLAFVNLVETAQPTLRFRTWAIDGRADAAPPGATPAVPATQGPTANRALRLSGSLLAAWSPAP